MSYKFEPEEGKEIDVFTAEEVEAAAKAREDAAIAKVAAEKDAEIEKYKKVSAEKTENFKKYNEMTEEEKKAYDANTVNLIKRGDQQAEKITELETKLSDKEEKEKTSNKNSALKSLHGDIPEVKTKVEEKYALLSGMPETTPEEINARAVAAAQLAGIQIDQRNPLFQSVHGEPPIYKEKTEYAETPEGKEALRLVREATGLPEPKK